jgi:hypothetical protein
MLLGCFLQVLGCLGAALRLQPMQEVGGLLGMTGFAVIIMIDQHASFSFGFRVFEGEIMQQIFETRKPLKINGVVFQTEFKWMMVAIWNCPYAAVRRRGGSSVRRRAYEGGSGG